MPTICLILPCFNEASRLKMSAFVSGPPGVTFLFVDDGSTDGTAALIRAHESDTIRLLTLPRNVGKAEAVRQGMLHAQRNGFLNHTDWVGYWDPDLATPLSELENFVAYGATFSGSLDGILGSRIYKLGSRIERSFKRHLFGRIFATIAVTSLDLKCYDSQCGAKLFRPYLVDQAFGRPFVSRWIFDVEVLSRLRSSALVEYPLRQWCDVPGSKITVRKVATRVAVDLFRICRDYRTS